MEHCQSSRTLLSELLDEARLDPAATAHHDGLSRLLTELIAAPEATPRIARDRIDALIADIDRRLTAQVNALLHAPPVQALESAWRGVKHLVAPGRSRRQRCLWQTQDGRRRQGLPELVVRLSGGHDGGYIQGIRRT